MNKYKVAKHIILNGTSFNLKGGQNCVRLGRSRVMYYKESLSVYLILKMSDQLIHTYVLSYTLIDQINDQIAHTEVYNNEKVALQAHCKSTLVRR